ncbi:MAG: TOBE domain-containing protein [Burkholderiaceae bacterium]|jgi:molybdate transport system regulatory protein|nr:TOBE domain-containing protein [Burkholderiaceae bacterium]
MKDIPSLVNAFDYQTADKRIEVLRLIDGTGSISRAARTAGISYKAAWQAIDTLSNLTGVALVERNVGGAGGGGARLTGAGKRLLEIALLRERERKRFFDELTRREGYQAGTSVPHLGIRTSMRNYLPCQVQSLEQTGNIVRVIMRLRDGVLLTARITLASAELLALKPGLPVIALCKAMAVKVSREPVSSVSPGANLLSGTVTRVAEGGDENELSVELEGRLQLVGFAPASQAIREQEQVTALVDESAVVVALP